MNIKKIVPKRVCVISRETQMIMRVSREFADNAVRLSPNYKFTSKSALKKFMKRDLQIKKNERFIKAIEKSTDSNRHKYHRHRIRTIQDSSNPNGRVYHQIGGFTNSYFEHYGGGQVLVGRY